MEGSVDGNSDGRRILNQGRAAPGQTDGAPAAGRWPAVGQDVRPSERRGQPRRLRQHASAGGGPHPGRRPMLSGSSDATPIGATTPTAGSSIARQCLRAVAGHLPARRHRRPASGDLRSGAKYRPPPLPRHRGAGGSRQHRTAPRGGGAAGQRPLRRPTVSAQLAAAGPSGGTPQRG